MIRNTTPAVDAMEQIRLEGNIIPSSWYRQIKTTSGRTYLLAVNILADLCYWYRPSVIREEETGDVIEVKKKFAAGMLQRSYAQWSDFFGVGKDTVKDACDRLIELGLIKRIFENIVTRGGLPLSNVMFVEPVVDAIRDITYRVEVGGGRGVNTPHLGDRKGGTYTGTTTKTTNIPPSEKTVAQLFDEMPSASQTTKPIELTADMFESGFTNGKAAKRYAEWIASVLGHQEPSTFDQKTAKELSEKGVDSKRFLEYCIHLQKNPFKTNGKEPTAYWIKSGYDEWRVNGFKELPKERTEFSGLRMA